MKENNVLYILICIIVFTVISQCFTVYVVYTPFFIKTFNIGLLLSALIGFLIPAIQVYICKKNVNSKIQKKIIVAIFSLALFLLIIIYDYFIILYSALSE